MKTKIAFKLILLMLTYQTSFSQGNWMNFFTGKAVYNVTGGQNEIWMLTESRLVRYDKATGNLTYPSPVQTEECIIYSTLTVDTQNNLWISGINSIINGIHKYDGSTWTNVLNYNFPHITIDNNNIAWFANNYKLYKFDGSNLIDYNIPPINSIIGIVREIKCDSNNHIWIASSIGLFKFTGTGFLYYSSNNSNLLFDDLGALFIDKNNNVWMGISNFDSTNQWSHGVSKFNGQNFQNFTSSLGNLPTLMDAIASMDMDTVENLWISTVSNGLLVYTDTSWIEINTGNSSIPTNNLGKFFIDENDIKWITGRGKGLIKYDNLTFTKINPANSLNIGPVRAIGFDKNWKTIISSVNNYQGFGALTQFNNLNWSYINNAPSNYLTAFYRDYNGDLWAGGPNKLYKYNGATWISYNANYNSFPHHIVKDLNDNIWVGTWGSGLYKFDGSNWNIINTGLGSTVSIHDLTIDASGNIWFTNGNELFWYDGNFWNNITSGSSTYPSGTILSMAFDHNNILWLGISGKGLIKYNGQIWTTYNTTNSAIPHNSIHKIRVDSYGNKWLGLSTGISKFDDFNFTNYNSTNSPIPNTGLCLNLEIDNYDNKWFSFNCQLIVMNENGLVLSDEIIPDEKRELVVYPNPINNELMIKGLTNSNSFKIYNLLGKEVYSKLNPVSVENLNVSDFLPGLYFIQVNFNERMIVKKFIKI